MLKLFGLAPFRLRCEFFGVDRLNHSRSPGDALTWNRKKDVESKQS
jgi:hypothetical protein